MNDLSISFGDKIKQLRELENISQKQLAEELNISSTVLNRYEKGTREADYRTIKLITQRFNTSADWLLDVKIDEATEHINKLINELKISQEKLNRVKKILDE